MTTSNKNIPHVEHYGRPAKRNLSRHSLYASGPEDVARGKWAHPSQARPQLAPGAYTDAVQAVTRDHAPKKHDRYV